MGRGVSAAGCNIFFSLRCSIYPYTLSEWWHNHKTVRESPLRWLSRTAFRALRRYPTIPWPIECMRFRIEMPFLSVPNAVFYLIVLSMIAWLHFPFFIITISPKLWITSFITQMKNYSVDFRRNNKMMQISYAWKFESTPSESRKPIVKHRRIHSSWAERPLRISFPLHDANHKVRSIGTIKFRSHLILSFLCRVKLLGYGKPGTHIFLHCAQHMIEEHVEVIEPFMERCVFHVLTYTPSTRCRQRQAKEMSAPGIPSLKIYVACKQRCHLLTALNVCEFQNK